MSDAVIVLRIHRPIRASSHLPEELKETDKYTSYFREKHKDLKTSTRHVPEDK